MVGLVSPEPMMTSSRGSPAASMIASLNLTCPVGITLVPVKGRLAGHVAIVALGPSGPTERGAQGPSGPTERGAQGPSGPTERGAQGPSGSEALARRLAGEGAVVVLVTSDAEHGGRLAAGIQAGTARHPAVYCTEGELGDDDLDALVELVGDLTR